MILPSLVPLPSIASTISDTIGAVAKVDSEISSTVTGGKLGGSNSSTDYITKGVIIVLGLLLIAAGIFSFDKTKQFIIASGKTAAKAAATA